MSAVPLPPRERVFRARLRADGGPPPRLLVTGFGPFPGAPKNPTESLVRAISSEPLEKLGARALEAVVLPTGYARSWEMLCRIFRRFQPDVVVHFGLNGGAAAIHVETIARNRIDVAKPDASGSAPKSGRALTGGPETLEVTLPTGAIVASLTDAGMPAALSDDAGDYVCNATLYRSLLTAPPGRLIGFIHVPPDLSAERLHEAAEIILTASIRSFAARPTLALTP